MCIDRYLNIGKRCHEAESIETRFSYGSSRLLLFFDSVKNRKRRNDKSD